MNKLILDHHWSPKTFCEIKYDNCRYICRQYIYRTLAHIVYKLIKVLKVLYTHAHFSFEISEICIT